MRPSTIQSKIFAFVVLLNIVLVTLVAAYVPSRAIELVRGAMTDRAAAYGRVLAREAEAPLQFDDEEAARELFASTTADHDITAIAIYKSDGQVLASTGTLRQPVTGVAAFTEQRTELTRDSLRAVTPIASKRGAPGVLVLEMSTARIEAERTRIREVSLSVGIGAFIVVLVYAGWIARSITHRIRLIANATHAVANGDLDQKPIEVTGADEVAMLATSFNVMHSNVRSLIEQVRAAGDREKGRATELAARTAEMRLVLDHVAQGMFIANADGAVTPGGSRTLEQWFGAPTSGVHLWDYLYADPTTRDWMRLCWSMLRDEALPFDVSIAQLPSSMRSRDRDFELRFQPIFDGSKFTQMLVVISDVTAQRARERADASQRELVSMFEHIAHDRAGFVEFFGEATALVSTIASEATPDIDLKRAVHTLKGNASLYGLLSVTEACQRLEDLLDENATTDEQRRTIVERWQTIENQIAAIVRVEDARIEIDETEYAQLVALLNARAPHATIAREVARWKLERASLRLERIAEQARSLATRLGKPNVRVTTRDNGLRLDSTGWTSFWSAFVHVVRNAIDHGLEPSAERIEAKKPEIGTILLQTYLSGDEFVLEIADDGRGIDWATLAVRGRAIGAPCSTEQERLELLFRDGVSTKEVATEISGRGIGLGAVRRECIEMGGRVCLDSVRGRGTTLQFRFPQSTMGIPRFTDSSVAA